MAKTPAGTGTNLTPERRRQTQWVFWVGVAAFLLFLGVPLVVVLVMLFR